REIVAEVAAHNSFWKPRLEAAGLTTASLTSLADLRRLPTLQKSDLVADQVDHPPYGTNLTQPVGAYTRLHQTSGTTTGRPMRWLDTPRNWSGLMECWRQIYRLMPLQPDERCCFPFSFGPFLGFWAGFEAATQQGRFVVAAGGLSSEARLQLIADNRITLVGCTPTYALRLAEVATQKEVDLTKLGVRTILVAGEPGGNIPAIRERIEAAWQADVVDHWGMTEVGPLGVTADGSKRHLTILETECIAEILHPDRDEAVAVGEIGELVVTTLCRPDSPVFRFRTGDFVRAATDADPQGRSLLRLDGGILSRVDDMLIVRGNNVFPSSIEAVIREQPEIVEYRIVCTKHREMQHLRIDIEPTPELSDIAVSELSTRLSHTLKDRLNFQAAVQPVPCGSLPRFEMKARRLVRE
ncbi:MAG TPA: AMP-binding protein, partial [Planctomycetaceae bacterium]|nr:AMP-binding protein [Planctomycetaceae bacterium]